MIELNLKNGSVKGISYRNTVVENTGEITAVFDKFMDHINQIRIYKNFYIVDCRNALNKLVLFILDKPTLQMKSIIIYD